MALDRAKVTGADRWCRGGVVWKVWVYLLVLVEGEGEGKGR